EMTVAPTIQVRGSAATAAPCSASDVAAATAATQYARTRPRVVRRLAGERPTKYESAGTAMRMLFPSCPLAWRCRQIDRAALSKRTTAPVLPFLEIGSPISRNGKRFACKKVEDVGAGLGMRAPFVPRAARRGLTAKLQPGSAR